ncbi:MAG: class I SAM-dependent methyltransferase [Gordonia sp. (in: high G+C Gram-positive bacteria)]|uniref:class I SAM-dependent methyltransferase n=1 Tax=Gordonia sp. (in: high G+C Gram-positive bacteria) TaxID=84139 RepID=UPI0039E6044B
MTFESVRAAYRARVHEYIAAVGRIDDVDALDLALISGWARRIEGPILDVGCGPGQWTHHLRELGCDVSGLDPVPEFVARARADHPDCEFRLGRAQRLDVDDDALGGVLAWYSLIHAEPEDVRAGLAEFARCVRPGGALAVGFFAGDRLERFDHAVVSAFRWPVDLLAGAVEEAGFAVTRTETRPLRPGRRHGALLAVRTSGSDGDRPRRDLAPGPRSG